MNIDVAKYVETILSNHTAVIIPGFGGLVSTYRSASIDHVQGLLYPPSLYVSFNEKLHVNDGVLMNRVMKAAGVSSEQARILIEQFVENAKIRLEKREIVVFPGVGRLYKDYEGRLQFLQDNTNFNQDAYGLPTIQYYPILRHKDSLGQEAPRVEIPGLEVKPGAAKPGRFASVLQSAQTVLPLLAGFAMIGFAAAYMIMTGSGNAEGIAENLTLPVAEKRVNKKPTTEEVTTYSLNDIYDQPTETASLGISNNRQTTASSTTIDEPLADETDYIMTEAEKQKIEIGPSRKRGVIIVGCYKFKNSIQKMADKVVDQGFDVYQAPIGSSDIIRVGAQFAYEDRKDLMDKLRIIQETIDHRAWILVE